MQNLHDPRRRGINDVQLGTWYNPNTPTHVPFASLLIAFVFSFGLHSQVQMVILVLSYLIIMLTDVITLLSCNVTQYTNFLATVSSSREP